ncbi:MAG: hypothetical protein ACXITV_06180 [Luteibaculaceae bacterium]
MRHLFWLIPFVLITIFETGCRRIEDFGSGLDLRFSQDTVFFDTVFTTVGSTTRIIRVFNRLDENSGIEKVYLGGGENSPFRMNVNGVSGKIVNNVEIFRRDSIFIFIEVTIDPNNSTQPLVVRDSIIFETQGRTQKVQLVAWGQDAYFHLNRFIQQPTIWPADKPHVLFGYTVVDTNMSLTIMPGAQVFIHGRASGLASLKGARIVAEGTRSMPITFQSDRRESFLANIPGQWERIWLIESNQSSFKHVIIRNAIRGLQVDTVDIAGVPSVNLENCIIENSSAAGILAQAGAVVNGENLLVRDAGQVLLALNSGGSFNFRHCTFANFFSFGGRTSPTLVFRNFFEGAGGVIFVRPVTNTRFDNCIFWGPLQNEFLVEMIPEGNPQFVFNHCIIRTNDTYENPLFFQNLFVNQAPGFVNTAQKNFNLTVNAFARGIGDPNFSNFEDLNGTIRPSIPAIGAFEFLDE